jgi:hypothetical protein
VFPNPPIARIASLLVATYALLAASRSLVGAEGEEIYKALLPRTAWLVVKDGESTHTGSAVLVRADQPWSIYVTNHHVVAKSLTPYKGEYVPGRIRVYFPSWKDDKLITDREAYIDREAYPSTYWQINWSGGRVIFSDPERDLAFVAVETVLQKDPLPKLRSIGATFRFVPVTPGETVYSVGCPGTVAGLWSFSPGSVRQVSKQARGRKDVLIVETTSPINPGDSGGPLVNGKGELVGINVSYRTNARLVSQSIAGDEVNALIDELEASNWMGHNDRIPKEHMANAISYYESIGHFGSALYIATQWVKKKEEDRVVGRVVGTPRIPDLDASDPKAEAEAIRLDKLFQSTQSQCYIAFQNKSDDDTIVVKYQLYSATDGKTFGWTEWSTVAVASGETVYLRDGDGNPLVASLVRRSAQGSRGGKWSLKEHKVRAYDQPYGHFSTLAWPFTD